jgi:RNA polymerase sigma factor (sigma-70 family)
MVSGTAAGKVYGGAVRGEPLEYPEPLIRRVYAYVAYRVGDGHDAEDITSDVFERALRHRDQFDPKRGEVAAWLIGIARRCISDHFADRLMPVESLPDEAAPGELAADAASRIDMTRVLATLPERDRELIALRYGADLTARQIGELLDMRTNAVEVALHRALQSVKDELEGDMTPTERERELRLAE